MKENSIEKDEEILNNIKAYMQENIDKGYHKFVYNDLGYDEKCVDVINAIEHILSDYKRVLKENEEVHKENEHLHREINRRIKLKIENEKIVDTQFISIQKIKDKIRHYQELQDNYIKKYDEINEGLQAMINVLQELIEEREGK